jgi:hypothetical protein
MHPESRLSPLTSVRNRPETAFQVLHSSFHIPNSSFLRPSHPRSRVIPARPLKSHFLSANFVDEPSPRGRSRGNEREHSPVALDNPFMVSLLLVS